MTRYFFTILVAVLLLTPCSQPYASEVITNGTVRQLVQAGLSEQLIITKIQNSDSNFSTETSDILQLKELGLSDDIISAMLRSPGLQPQVIEPEAPLLLNYDDISPLIEDGQFQEAYAKLNKISQSDPTNPLNNLVELEIMVAEASFAIKTRDPARKTKIRNAAVKLKAIYRTYYTDTSYWMSYANYYWMLGRENGTLKCLKKVLYYNPAHLEGLILKGEVIMKSLLDTPYSNEDSESMFRDSFMAEGREAYLEALNSAEITKVKKAEVHYKLGLYEKEIFKNTSRAQNHWKKVIEIAPGSPWAVLAQEKMQQ